MKFEDYTWDKEFEIKGYFSELPGDVINNSLIDFYISHSLKILKPFGIVNDELESSFVFRD